MINLQNPLAPLIIGSGLAITINAGTIIIGNTPTTIPQTTVGLTANATNYIFVSNTGVLTVNTTGFTTGCLPICTVVTNSSNISTISDNRPDFSLPTSNPLLLTPSADQTIASFNLTLANGELATQLLTNTSLTANPYVHLSGVSSIIGAGPHQGSPNTPQGWYNTMTGGTGKGVEAGTFAISIPSTYNGTTGVGFVTNAIGAYVWTQDANHYAVGLSNQTVVDATNGFGWGINPQIIAYGANGATNQTLHIIEADAVVQSTSVTLYGVQVGAPTSSTQNPVKAIAFDVTKPSWPNGVWSNGLSIETGATGGNSAILLNPQATGASQSSQILSFVGTTAGNVSVTANMSADANGDLVIVPAVGGFIRNSQAGSGIQLLSSGSNFTQITNTATTFRSIVFPDASGNLLVDTATQNVTNKAIDSSVIGGVTPAAGNFTTLGTSGLITKYNNINTAGNGISSVYAAVSQKAETAADTNVLTLTPPASVGTYRINFVLSLSAANTATLGWTATWTDSNGNAQAPTNLSLLQEGTAAPALTFTTSSPGNYYGTAIVDINNSAANIVVKLTFSGTSFAGKASATVERLI